MESLVGLVTSFFGGWGYLAAGGVVMAAVGLFLWRVRASGARREREKRAQQQARARSVSDKIDDKVSGQDTTTSREELREWAKH